MPEIILIDLNVILDVLLERKNFEASRSVLQLSEQGSHQLHISAHMVTTFAYLLENAKVPRTEILRNISWILQFFMVSPVDGTLLELALKSKILDYEDAVVEQIAILCQAETIVTRNIKDFQRGAITALTPEEFIKASRS